MLREAASSVPIDILRRLAEYSRMYKLFLKAGNPHALMFEPFLHYDKQRNYGKLDRKADTFVGFTDQLSIGDDAKMYSTTVKKDLYFAQTMVTYALNLTKEERNRAGTTNRLPDRRLF